MSKFLDQNGLVYLWSKITSKLSGKANISDVPSKLSDLINDAGFITSSDIPEGAAASTTVPKMDGTPGVGKEMAFARGDHVHPTDTSRLATNGDGSNVTVTFNLASTRDPVVSGDNLSVAMGKLAKTYSDFGSFAYKSNVTNDDLDATIKASLAKADTALQSYTETDPNVPAWAKEPTKPIYTAAEVGAIPAADADTFAKKSDLANVYIYKGSKADYASLPSTGNTVGDVWNVESSGMNYAWTGEDWDALGEIFEIESITNIEIDAITG